MRTCRVCNIPKDEDLFYAHPVWVCKVCVSAYHKSHRFKNADRLREAHKARYLANKESYSAKSKARYLSNSEHIKKVSRDYYDENKEKCLESLRNYRNNNAEKLKEQKKNYLSIKENWDRRKKAVSAWKRKHPERTRVQTSRRRAKKYGNGGSHTVEDVHMLYLRQGRKCANLSCRKSIQYGYHIDHVMPISKGGSDNAENLQLLCPTCNICKSNKHPDVWAKEKGMLFA